MADPDLDSLRTSYDADAPRRNNIDPAAWRLTLVDELAHRLESSGRTSVVDLGCGTGQLAARLASHGLEVTAIDLSAENVARTKARGISSFVADFGATPFADGSFDGALAFNSFLHVPKAGLARVLKEMRRILSNSAIAMVVVWGGRDSEGADPGDWLDPPRFFSFFADGDFASLPTEGFRRLETRLMHEHQDDGGGLHPQMMMLEAV